MIQETYCSFEQAKALKELGYPQDLYYGSYFYDENGKQSPFNGIPLLVPECICPTLSLVQKWLREEKELCIEISYVDINNYGACIYTPDYQHDADTYIPIEGMYSYEQALSIGIDKCIELLKEK